MSPFPSVSTKRGEGGLVDVCRLHIKLIFYIKVFDPHAHVLNFPCVIGATHAHTHTLTEVVTSRVYPVISTHSLSDTLLIWRSHNCLITVFATRFIISTPFRYFPLPPEPSPPLQSTPFSNTRVCRRHPCVNLFIYLSLISRYRTER